VELTVEKISSDGSGIARTGDGVIFVSGALPGEVVEGEVVLRKRDFAFACVKRIIQANPRRAEPICPVFGNCGGCQLQHASYELQLEIKAGIVKDALTRIGGLGDALSGLECTPSPRQWGYRNKASFPVRKIKGKPTMGFFKPDSHFLVPVQRCPVNAAPLNDLFSVMQNELPGLQLDVYDEREHKGALRHVILRAGIHTGQTLVSLVLNGRLNSRNMKSITGLCRPLKNITTLTLNHNSRPGNVILGNRTEAVKGDGLISERLDDWTLSYDTSSFFQVNTDQAASLYRHARNLARVGKDSRVLELYSGVGALTCYLAEAGSITAAEEWESAANLMEKNLRHNGIHNAKVIKGKAEELLSASDIGPYDLVVLDPPRGGCDRAVLERIMELNIDRVLYVSCNPATLARDAKILKEGGYALKSVRAFDMFPQTVHVETAVLMER
jgi:23S rRNA (uracil1939-C5)-methyltransferase